MSKSQRTADEQSKVYVETTPHGATVSTGTYPDGSSRAVYLDPVELRRIAAMLERAADRMESEP